jgi:N-acetylmuramoyl-L-alanine amidase CwlA
MALNITDAYLPVNKYSRPGTKINPTKIAVHYVGNAGSSAMGNRNYFASGKVYASSHYIIGLDGEILRLIPETEISYCTNSANSYTISIECCHPDATGKFNSKTLASLIALCADICKRRSINPVTGIIRHYDVTKKCCPRWWAPNGPNSNANADFATFKNQVKAAMSGTTTTTTTTTTSTVTESKKTPAKLATTKVTTYDGAIKILQTAKVINSPQFWYNAEKTIKYISPFMINAANAVYDSEINTIKDINAALAKLVEKKVITSEDYWSDACTTNKYLVDLVIAIAKRV